MHFKITCFFFFKGFLFYFVGKSIIIACCFVLFRVSKKMLGHPRVHVVKEVVTLNLFLKRCTIYFNTRFGDKVSHVLINKYVCATPVVFQSQATVQCKLHSIDPEIFPLLETTDVPVSTF